ASRDQRRRPHRDAVRRGARSAELERRRFCVVAGWGVARSSPRAHAQRDRPPHTREPGQNDPHRRPWRREPDPPIPFSRDPSEARPKPRWEHEHQRRAHRRKNAHRRATLRHGPRVEGRTDDNLTQSQVPSDPAPVGFHSAPHMATDSFYGEEESVAPFGGVGRPGYAEGAGRLSVTVDAHPARSKTYEPQGGHSDNHR